MTYDVYMHFPVLAIMTLFRSSRIYRNEDGDEK